MKIALLTDGIYPYVIGGMQKHSYYLAKYFAKNKIYVDVFYCQKNLNVLNPFTNEELDYITLYKLEFPKLDIFPGHYIRESYKYSCTIFNCIKLNLNEYDFIYAQGFAGWNLIEQKQKGIKCPPIGTHFHGLNMFQSTSSFKEKIAQLFFLKPVKYILNNSDIVFSLGGKLTSIITKNIHDQYKISTIPIGIEENWIIGNSFSNSKIRNFTFVGRYERLKGIEELSLVLKKICQTHNFKFHFIGPIPNNKMINSDKIIYHGLVLKESLISKLLHDSDFLVCPSFSEGMPTVILEAMASGCAIIATDVGAVSEQVQGNGWLLPYPNVNLLETAMIEAITIDDDSLLEMKKKSIALVKEKFLWSNVIIKNIRAIENILHGKQKNS